MDFVSKTNGKKYVLFIQESERTLSFLDWADVTSLHKYLKVENVHSDNSFIIIF
jgi:hypothetical protein